MAQRFSGIISVKWWQKELGRVYHREQNTLNKSQFIFNKRKAWLGQRAGVICDAVMCVAVFEDANLVSAACSLLPMPGWFWLLWFYNE